ncbi:stressosome-associated protein Prli42 [Paenibacillus alkaliterrae]|nr:stressosome-associated protein Prli42 [Paenibacillus alkaliterrae]MCF2937533.1 stressosome-associated protein Prli42 [Paenibacillus alkaliterrae]
MHRQQLMRIIAIVLVSALLITTLFAGIGSLFY